MAFGQATRNSLPFFGRRSHESNGIFSFGLDAKGLGQTHLNLSINLIGGVYQSGALFSYDVDSSTEPEIILRVGVSFVSADQACANAESEVGDSTFDEVMANAKALWQEKLSKVEIDVANTPADLNELYSALLTDGDLNPPEWNIEGRQVNVYKQFGYVPFAVLDVSSTGRQTREGSRTLEYAFEDFGIRQVAQLLGNTADMERYTNRSLFYRNVWDPAVESDGYKGFMQKRYSNGTFAYTNPIDCSPQDTNTSRACSLQDNNVVGFYESSSWEYSWCAQLVDLVAALGTENIIGLFHMTRHIWSSSWEEILVAPAGIPGNDDQAAMASLLSFHLLGLYPGA
ncbi:hypothetical protein H0H92_002361 [Tricholoma furcatifolium]|nr:hypothetical protein H0H92_002361 [Tricholoma furcatifolium]